MKRGLFYKGSMMVSFEKEPYETRARLQRRRGACVCISSKHSELYNGVFTVNTAESWCVAVCCSVLQCVASELYNDCIQSIQKRADF